MLTRTADSSRACKQVDTGVAGTVANTVNGVFTAVASGSTFRCSRCSLWAVCTARGLSKYVLQIKVCHGWNSKQLCTIRLYKFQEVEVC